ncbi:methyltransferase domain-containing protein [Mycetohabitans sp. B8]|uniref:methyltransferase domain-containing protein n=1 Tax=Mycetohabitans sp. B8 TaxID=2841845 RepID=UPI001F00C2DE|nr:methyltransferase domain-containing protein [Mycetohabitans sp. B8]MCG1043459.1 methyltransferase domain-containing protein [Mycetohabitans sp. B8]
MPTDHDRPADQDTDAGAQRATGLRQLRQSFDRRAAQFRDVAFLPREIAQRMHERLQYIKLQPARVLDAGCGAGEDLEALRARFAQASVYGADLSRAMLVAAHSSGSGGADAASGQPASAGGWRRLLPAALRHLASGRAQPRDRVQADFGALPFAPECFDLLWSNLALQWHARPDQVFPEWQRVLKTGGLLMFSTLGPDTLRELRGAWALADDGAAQHVLDFVDMHDCGDMLVASGFEIPVMDMETLTITYSSPQSLLADVRRWGAMPPQGTRRGDVPRGLMSRGTYRRLLDALEAQRQPDGTIPLTFEVVYGHAWKAMARVTPEGHGIVRVDEIGHMSRGVRRTSS